VYNQNIKIAQYHFIKPCCLHTCATIPDESARFFLYFGGHLGKSAFAKIPLRLLTVIEDDLHDPFFIDSEPVICNTTGGPALYRATYYPDVSLHLHITVSDNRREKVFEANLHLLKQPFQQFLSTVTHHTCGG
jgi:hypothetical protein